MDDDANRPSALNLGPTQAKYSDPNPLVRFANRRFFQALAKLLSEVPFRSVLDAGCGEGLVLGRIQSPQVVGIDLDRQRVILARASQPRPSVAVANVERLPFAPASFDLVIMLEVFEHVGNPETALKEVARVSREYLLASVPNEPWWRIGNIIRLKYLRGLGNTPEHINHWSTQGFARFLSHSFSVLLLERPFLWTFALGRKIQKRSI
jgi:SAM-dependent methyltransferase